MFHLEVMRLNPFNLLLSVFGPSVIGESVTDERDIPHEE